MKRRLLVLLLLTSAALPMAFGAPVTYTLTGYVQATGAGQQVNAPFVWTVFADTANITNPSPGRYQNAATSSSIAFTGVATTNLTGVTVYLDTAKGQVTFGNSATGGIGLTSTQLQTWDLAAPIGPLNGANFMVAGSITTDTGTTIVLNGVANSSNNGPSPTFQATQPPPTVTNVVNAASNIVPGLPNAGIAQGAIFVAFGSGLGPANIAIAPAPFQSTTLSNTSVAITVNGTTVNAPLYYTVAGQISGLLPSNTPAGTGTMTVTYNGRVGTPAPITVVANNVGIFTVTADGQGSGIVTYADYSLVSPAKAANCGGPNTTCGAANPGDTLILWATGLGPVNGSDASGAGLGQNMPNLPLSLWIGGVQAPVLYQGRSGCCVGEDQIVFTVPNNVPTGCAVPMMIQINNQVSNAALIPIATGSRSCTPAKGALATVNTQQAFANLPLNYAQIQLSRDFGPNGQGYTDMARLQFLKILSIPAGIQPFILSYLDDSALGTCSVFNSPNSKLSPTVGNAAADAGSSFTLTGPNGSKLITGSGKITFTLSSTGTYLSPGSYMLTGSGGADIGVIGAPFVIPQPPAVTSPTPGISGVTRSNGLPVTWTAGAASSVMQLQVTSATDGTGTNAATIVCNVPAAKGSFTVPAYAMAALPAGNFGGLQAQQITEMSFSAKGLDLGLLDIFNAGTFVGFNVK